MSSTINILTKDGTQNKAIKTTRKTTRNLNKRRLWNIFDNEMNDNEKPTNKVDGENNNKLECIYTDENIVEIDYENCSLCESELKRSQEGFYVCSNLKCGTLYKNRLEEGAEWRYYGADDNNAGDPTRCGMPINPLLKEASFGCRVLYSGTNSYEMRKLRKYTEWQSMPVYKEKSQYEEFEHIKRMAYNYGIPKIIIDDALRYHKIISESRKFRGLNRDGIIAASLYIASDINKFPRTPKEIANIFHLDNKSATKGCKNAKLIINTIEKENEDENKTEYCKKTPISFIHRYCSKIDINEELIKLCEFIAIKVENENLIPENTPISIAAGIIYFIASIFHLEIKKRTIHNISKVSEVTIDKCFKKLNSFKEKLIPPILIQKYEVDL